MVLLDGGGGFEVGDGAGDLLFGLALEDDFIHEVGIAHVVEVVHLAAQITVSVRSVEQL